MSKFIKYALAVATLLIVCATLAFAADGDPVVATVNGQPYTSLSDAVSAARVGDRLIVVSDVDISSPLTIYGDFILPAGIHITSSAPLNIYGQHNSFYGDIVNTSSDIANFITIMDGESHFFGNVYSSIGSRPVTILGTSSDNVRVTVYSGSFLGKYFGISNYKSAENLVVRGGFFSSTINGPYSLNGSSIVSSNPLVVSWGGLYELGQIVSESISWIGLFCAAILANKLLLIFIIFVLGFVGLGLIKRIINN